VSNGRTHHLTTVSEKDLVLVPLAFAEPFLRTFFAVQRATQGTNARLVLRASNAAHSVICYTIHWESEGGGPYPAFDGELMVDADENFNGFWIVLTGAYVAPGGAAGQLFDARALLREMRVEIEALYRAEVQTKAG